MGILKKEQGKRVQKGTQEEISICLNKIPNNHWALGGLLSHQWLSNLLSIKRWEFEPLDTGFDETGVGFSGGIFTGAGARNI